MVSAYEFGGGMYVVERLTSKREQRDRFEASKIRGGDLVMGKCEVC